MAKTPFDWQAHRGSRGLYPENTIFSMLKSLDFSKTTTLEMDVVISKDGEVVVSHEPWMSSEICTDPKGKPVEDMKVNLYALTYKEIAEYDCGMKPHPRFPRQEKMKAFKPKLSTLIDDVEKEIKKRKITRTYNIEIKSTPDDEKNGFQPDIKTFTDKVVTLVKKKLPVERFFIQSFDWRVLNYLHSQYPKVQTVALIEEKYEAQTILKKLDFTPTVFSPDFNLLTKEDIVYFQKQKIKVIPWTVNKTEDMKRLVEMGVDGIITDYPDLIP